MNPFQAIRDAVGAHEADTLARVFCASSPLYTAEPGDPWQQVWAIGRFERRCRLAEPGNERPREVTQFLHGRHFDEWQDDRGELDESRDTFEAIRGLAQEYMGDRA